LNPFDKGTEQVVKPNFIPNKWSKARLFSY
jgi:hypothetical protein